MSGNSGDFVEKLKYNIDIVDIVSDYVPLKKAGNNYKALCPFHQEKTASFNVNQEKQFYYCFGCGAGGDVINFLMDIENITFRETLKILSERAGMSLPADDNPFQQKRREERERIFLLNKLTARFYHYLLLNSEVGNQAVKYLENRGFGKKDYQQYYLGYAPDNWQTLAKFLVKRGFMENELLQAGVVSRGKNGQLYDRFRDRVIFPIFNIRGEVIAFGGRILDDDKSAPKYLNSPDTPVYKKGENLYGLNWARDKIRQTGDAVIMEGYTDVLTAHKNGIQNTIASLGTAFTSEQARLLKRYASNIYISYDADGAGTRATLRGLDIVSQQGLNVRVVQLPDNKDPDQFIKTEGKNAFEDLEKEAVNLTEFKIDQLAMKFDLSRVDEKINFTNQLIVLLANIDDSIKRDLHLQNAAERFQIENDTLKNGVLAAFEAKDSKKKDKNYKYRYTKNDNKTNQRETINNIEASILKLYLDNPDKRGDIFGLLKINFFTGIYQELVKLIRENPDAEIDKLLSLTEKDKLRKLLLSLTVSDINQSNQIENILEKFIIGVKSKIYSKLQMNNDLKLEIVNQMLFDFITMTL